MRNFLLKLNVALAFSLVVTGPTWAATVDCAVPESMQAAVDAAADGDTITITGECDETVRINRRNDLTLEGPVGDIATISQDIVACDTVALALNVLRINDSTNIRLRRLKISGGNGG